MKRLTGKVAVVTGGAQGIGRAIVERFHSEGAKVLLADINPKGAQVAQAIADDGSVYFRQTDVRQEAENEAMVAVCVEQFGQLDIVVNNAWAYRDDLKNLAEVTAADWRHSFDMAMSATLWSTKYAVPFLKHQGGGSLISLASVHGVQTASGWLLYDPFKAGLIHLIKTLALELGPQHIRVNAISPGLIMTEEVKPTVTEDYLKKAGYPYALGRPGTPQEVANAALFLASDESSFITAHNLMVDGGLTAQLPDALLDRYLPN